MRRTVYLAPPRGGLIITTFVVLFYVGIVLPLKVVWLFMRYVMPAFVIAVVLSIRWLVQTGMRQSLDDQRRMAELADA